MTERELGFGRFPGLTYPELQIDNHTLDENLPILPPPVDGVRRRAAPTADAGALEGLPLELLQAVLTQLDLRSLLDIRCVSRRTADLVDSLFQFRAIKKHARNALRGILAINVGRWTTCAALYEALRTSDCAMCGDFGGYLYLLTCQRVCFICLTQDMRYLPLSLGQVRRKFGVRGPTLAALPRMRAVCGTYSPHEKEVAEPVVLIDYATARSAGIALHGSLRAMCGYVVNLNRKMRAVREAKAEAVAATAANVAGTTEATRTTGAAPDAQRLGQAAYYARRPPATHPRDDQTANPLRFVAIARVPWLSRTTHEVEWGFHCVGCEMSRTLPLHCDRKFTAASFEDHLKQCGNIQDGQHHPD